MRRDSTVTFPPPNRACCLNQQNTGVCDILSGAQFIRKHHTTPLILQRKHNHVYHHPRRCCQCCWVRIGPWYSCLCRKFELWRFLRIVRALYSPPWTTLVDAVTVINEPTPQVRSRKDLSSSEDGILKCFSRSQWNAQSSSCNQGNNDHSSILYALLVHSVWGGNELTFLPTISYIILWPVVAVIMYKLQKRKSNFLKIIHQ